MKTQKEKNEEEPRKNMKQTRKENDCRKIKMKTNAKHEKRHEKKKTKESMKNKLNTLENKTTRI